MGVSAPFLNEVNMSDKKEKQAKLLAAERKKRSQELEKSQKAAGRVTVKQLAKAREEGDPKLKQLVTKYKTQGSLKKFLDEERARKWKEALAKEKKRTGRK